MMMAVDIDLASILTNLKLEDPWLPPMSWESIPSESGLSLPSKSPSSRLYDTPTVSEASLVRLAMNALQGLESSLMSIDKLCAIFRSDPADRSFHRIPSLWNQSISTLALEKMLGSLGRLGGVVFLLRRFISYFRNLTYDETLRNDKKTESEAEENKRYCDKAGNDDPPYSLVNQAFAVAVGDVLEGYIAALDTISSSVGLRRSSNADTMSCTSTSRAGCLSSVGHSEVTLLEVYLHTQELRSQIEVLGSICNVHDVDLSFSLTPFEDSDIRTQFSSFPRGGNLLTYLYTQLKVADPAHSALLKILFIRASEPYFEFVRSWIFKAKITDPFNEFLVANADSQQSFSLCSTGMLIDFPSAAIREQDGVSVPCFLRDFLIPLFRAGQQLQVLMKLLEFCNGVGSWNRTYEDFLPYWSSMSTGRLSHASPLAFTKEGIEMLVLARRKYYSVMMEKLENHLPSVEFKYRQVIQHNTIPTSVLNHGGSLEVSSAVSGTSVSPSVKNTNPNLPLGTNSDASSLTEEFSYVEDPFDSSECSSIRSSEEEEEVESKVNECFHDTEDLEKKCLSALEFDSRTSLDISFKKHSQNQSPSIKASGSHEFSEKSQQWRSNMKITPLELDRNLSCMMEAQYRNDQLDTWSLNPFARDLICDGRRNIDDTWSNFSRYRPKNYLNPGVHEETTLDCEYMIPTSSDLVEEAANKHHLRPWEVKYLPKDLCANPILGTRKLGERCTKYTPSFDFGSVKDPFTECVDRLGSSNRRDQFSVSADGPVIVTGHHDKGRGSDAVTGYTKNPYDTRAPLGSKANHLEHALLPNVSGGSGWELLLGGSGETTNTRHCARRAGAAAVIEIPLDFVLEKCLLEEIQLQYTYVSKLTIKLLEESFSLREHLLALRRYHMMESADWADLFIMSLWHHKWYATEADTRISEIQGLLELSVQRSSCERDQYKDRLFVYTKERCSTSLPALATGIGSFNVLGLGYRVDWPVSIVLTPGALKIYAQIFSFLIQVKLALSSLTEVWCSFKGLVHFTNRDRYSDLYKSESRHFNAMVKLRHQIFHFVSTLQQYVQSQLSHVSWCRFLQSLKHKVKDLMDLELVHTDYLNDSQCICFLSNDMQQIADIIQRILQCALDFRSAVIPINSAGLDGRHPNTAQVVAIKEEFDKNLRQLYVCYLNAPKHVELGLPRFWEYLDYNQHYSDIVRKEMGGHTFAF